MSRLFVGNLPFEEEVPGIEGRPPDPIPRTARRAASALATLLRALARPGDRIWTPRPVDPGRMADVPGLPRPRLVSGPLGEHDVSGGLFAWAESVAVAALRERAPRIPPEGDDLAAALLAAGAPDPETAVRVNDRRWGLDLARRLGCALPGATVIHSRWGLEKHLAEGGADAAPGSRWVLKSPLSAAGRHQARGRGAEVGKETVALLEGVLGIRGALVFEPWMERRTDYGVTGVVSDGGAERLAVHRLLVDDHGRFRGIVPGGAGEDEAALRETAARVGRALAAEGCRGVDGFRYVGADGAERLHPLVEVNARTTFGHLARALAERTGLGPAPALHAGRPPPDPGDAVVLLRPGDRDATAARLAVNP